MKRAVITILALTLVSGCLSACGEKQDEIVRIEASNAAGNATGEEREYEDTNKEPVVRPDQRQDETDSEEEQQQEVDTSEIDTSIYGNWFEDDGSAFSIYKENDEIMFSGYDAETDRGLFGTVQSDEETYIEFKQNKELEETETIDDEEQTIPEDINVDELEAGYSYDPEKGLQQEVNVIEQYGSEEEFNKAMEEESKQIEEGTINEDTYEIVRYNIDSIEIQMDIKQVVMTISNESKTYVLRKNIE